MADNLRYFRVSGRGNGIGITILRRATDTGGPGPRTLTIHIFPKVWFDYFAEREAWLGKRENRKESDFRLVRELPSSETFGDADNWHTYLYEVDVLALTEEWAKCLDEVTKDSDDLIEEISTILESEDAEEGEIDPLWEEVSTKWSKKRYEDAEKIYLKELAVNQANFMWKLLAHYDQNPSRVAGHREFPPSSMELLPDVPALKEAFYAQFAEKAKEAVRHRKPVFLPVEEELNFVRGRMVPKGLIDRKVRSRLPVLCEYDALTTDSYIWQVIRAATQIIATSEKPGTIDAAVEIDAQIRDISLVPASALLTQHVPNSEFARLTPELKIAYLLGRSILSHKFGVGIEEPLTEGGVIANIKYTTSDLWEKMVAGYLQASFEDAELEEQGNLYLFYKEKDKEEHTGKPKNPDIILTQEDRRLVLDAKYKRAKEDISSASMSDQYQLVTYSYRMGCDAFLVYFSRGKPSDFTVKLEVSYLAPPGYGYPDTDQQDWHRIGVLSLPFPGPDEAGVFEELSIKDLQKELLHRGRVTQANKRTA